MSRKGAAPFGNMRDMKSGRHAARPLVLLRYASGLFPVEEIFFHYFLGSLVSSLYHLSVMGEPIPTFFR